MLSASEIKTFIHFLPLMIGHKMMDKQKLFPEYNLKPKHHLLLQYDDCIKNSGPLRHYMSFSCEQKNRIVKKYSKVCHQRINLAWSLTYKCLMQFNSFIIEHENGFPPLYFTKNENHVKKIKTMSYFSKNLFDNSWNTETVTSFKWIKFENSLFKIKFYIALFDKKIECYEIVDILEKSKKIFLVLAKVEILDYSDHMLCYLVDKILKVYKLFELEKLEYYPFNLHQTVDGKKAFRLKKFKY